MARASRTSGHRPARQDASLRPRDTDALVLLACARPRALQHLNDLADDRQRGTARLAACNLEDLPLALRCVPRPACQSCLWRACTCDIQGFASIFLLAASFFAPADAAPTPPHLRLRRAQPPPEYILLIYYNIEMAFVENIKCGKAAVCRVCMSDHVANNAAAYSPVYSVPMRARCHL